jgi:hypothetical protein
MHHFRGLRRAMHRRIDHSGAEVWSELLRSSTRGEDGVLVDSDDRQPVLTAL